MEFEEILGDIFGDEEGLEDAGLEDEEFEILGVTSGDEEELEDANPDAIEEESPDTPLIGSGTNPCELSTSIEFDPALASDPPNGARWAGVLTLKRAESHGDRIDGKAQNVHVVAEVSWSRARWTCQSLSPGSAHLSDDHNSCM
eukprot:COSAG02_NODE_31634_length_530_cov_0.837587_1_plen_143_part_01